MMSRRFISSYQRLGDKFTADSFRAKQMEGTEERDRGNDAMGLDVT